MQHSFFIGINCMRENRQCYEILKFGNEPL